MRANNSVITKSFGSRLGAKPVMPETPQVEVTGQTPDWSKLQQVGAGGGMGRVWGGLIDPKFTFLLRNIPLATTQP